MDAAVQAWNRHPGTVGRLRKRGEAGSAVEADEREVVEAAPVYDLPTPPPRHRFMTPEQVAHSVEWRATMAAAADRVILTGRPATVHLPETVFLIASADDEFWFYVNKLLHGTGWTLANHPHDRTGLLRVLESLSFPDSPTLQE